ncbi:hypothetical protein [Streptomyces sp. AF1A]|jgi:hypothetical protein|uniref:hypothetical protein n=1 Tax=Streptomyces sp. AF1A TaxID=3394350 RepID=UPI0039BC531F
MAPIPAEPSDGPSGIRRGRHRKPRPRKVLLAAGGLALAAGVLSLVRISPDSGVGAPGTAEAEPRVDPGGGATDRSVNTAATAGGPTALPSATSVMGGRSSTPTPGGSPAPTATGTSAPSSGDASVPTTIPTGAPTAPGSTPHSPATTSAPRPNPTTTAPAQAPAPSHSTAPPAPGGGLCLPVVGLCVDVLGSPRN